jgi:hypothetical protein
MIRKLLNTNGQEMKRAIAWPLEIVRFEEVLISKQGRSWEDANVRRGAAFLRPWENQKLSRAEKAGEQAVIIVIGGQRSQG